ncbi:MAG: cytochrome c [Terracidiphilus sp.]|jgi:mono/diheme cytochrome c family protein
MKLSLAVFALLLACSSAAAYSRGSRRAHGAAIFNESGCAHCHAIGNAGGHKGPDLSGVGRRMKKVRMQRQIANGSKLMPPFGEDLQGQDMDDLLAYLRACRSRKQ